MPLNSRIYSERRRRSGDGRKRDIFEERGAASEEEYFRKETARQLKELREQQARRKAKKENQIAEETDKTVKKDKIQEGRNREKEKNTSVCSDEK